MAYTPVLSIKESAELRRIAWAKNMPMTKTLSEIIEKAVRKIDHWKICDKCRDRACEDCRFKEGK